MVEVSDDEAPVEAHAEIQLPATTIANPSQAFRAVRDATPESFHGAAVADRPCRVGVTLRHYWTPCVGLCLAEGLLDSSPISLLSHYPGVQPLGAGDDPDAC